MASRLATLACLLLLLAAPAAGATILERWSASQEPPAGPSGNETLHRLGDVDGDGRDEVLRVRQDGGALRAEVVRGPDLEHATWSVALPGMAFWDLVADQDGDGIADLVTVSGSGHATSSGQGALVASVGTSEHDEERRLESRSGAEGRTIGNFRDSYVGRSTYAAAFPLVAFAVAYNDESRINTTLFLEGQRLRFESAFEATGAWTSAGNLARMQQHLTVSVLDASGRTVGSASFGGDRAIIGGGIGDVDGDGFVDVVVLESTRPVPVGVAPAPTLGADRLSVVAGSDASVLWRLEGELGVQDAYRPMGILVLGDLDGDGSGELGLHGFMPPGLTIRSGTDGSILRQEPGDAVALPWADVDGDGRAEYLRVGWAGGGEGFTFAARGLDGGDVWRYQAPENADPVVESFKDVLFGRWTDWTLDGVPDLMLADEEVFLVDGADGSEVFRHEARHPHSIRSVEDLTGDGGRDLLLTRLTDEDGDRPSMDDSNVTLHLDVLRGSDGVRAWTSRQVFAEGGVHAVGRGIGDIDGDGAEDLLVELTRDCCEQECFDDSCTARPVEEGAGPERWMVIHSGRDGRVLWRDHAAQADGAPARSEPIVEVGAAFAGTAGAEGTGVPLPAWTLLLALLAVLWARRR